MKKEEVLKITDEVMNNRKINSIREAILTIREKILEIPDSKGNDDWTKEYCARLKLRGDNEPCCAGHYFSGAKYLCIDTSAKVDSGEYGLYWYE